MARTRLYDHIDLRVSDRARAQKFYGAILPALGFSQEESGGEWGAFAAPGEREAFFGFTEDRNHRPNANRIAFWAESREQVDRLAVIVREAEALKIEGPQLWPEYSPGYYAFFFEDPDGNKLEVCCRGSSLVAD